MADDEEKTEAGGATGSGYFSSDVLFLLPSAQISSSLRGVGLAYERLTAVKALRAKRPRMKIEKILELGNANPINSGRCGRQRRRRRQAESRLKR